MSDLMRVAGGAPIDGRRCWIGGITGDVLGAYMEGTEAVCGCFSHRFNGGRPPAGTEPVKPLGRVEPGPGRPSGTRPVTA